jgi:hypothetical protein
MAYQKTEIAAKLRNVEDTRNELKMTRLGSVTNYIYIQYTVIRNFTRQLGKMFQFIFQSSIRP